MRRNLHQWVGNTALAAGLADILSDPLFQKAIQVAQEELEEELELVGDNIIDRAALSHAASKGARRLVEKLEILARPTDAMIAETKPKVELPKPYSHLASSGEKHSVT